MREDSEQKLVVFEDESCMEVPDSDGENMPDNKYEFNTKKRVDVSDNSAYKTVKSSSFVDSSLAHAYV